jgi:type VI secretion system protein ImpG
VTVASASWTTPDRLRPPVRASDASAALRLELRCFSDVTFSLLELTTLRLHLNGDGNLVSSLYELLGNNCVRILVRDTTPGSKRPPIELPRSALQPVGFGEDEGMLPYPRRSFAGYRLLQEYFAFPAKFLFFDLSGFDQLRAAGFGAAAEIVFLISPFERADRRPMLESGVTEQTVRLGCTPIINLFPQTSEPILLTQRRLEYLVVPDARRRLTTEVFSVDDVVGITPGNPEPLRFAPFHSHRHDTDAAKTAGGLFWYASRRPSGWRTDSATEVMLSFVDLSSRRVSPDLDAVTARLTCFNADLPTRLPFGSDRGDFELHGGGPIRRILALAKPTSVVQPPLGKAQLWRLISQLSLNYLSLVEGGLDALQEILRLHDFSAGGAGGTQIRGVVGVRSGPAYARVMSEHGLSFARGRRVELEFDEDQFAGGGAYLFASVLERFLALYASLNSFTVLAARTQQRRSMMREWEPRAGWKTVL